MKNNLKSRNYNIDVLKFICMLSIIIIHLIGKGGLLVTVSEKKIDDNIYIVISNLLMISVNIFCIISGFLYVNKKEINNTNIIKIIFDIIIYSIIITSIFYTTNLFGIRNLGINYMLDSIFPSKIGRYWFITCYIFMFFIIPYLNIFLQNISKEKLKKLIIIIFFMACILQELCMYDLFRLKWGYSPFWLIYLYIIGAYEKKFGIEIDTKKNILFLIICLLTNTTIVLITQNCIQKSNAFYYLGEHYTSPTIVISSILFFHLFLKLNIKNNIFGKLGKYSLSVIIIHGHRLIYDYLINNKMLFIKKYNIIVGFLIIILTAISIYILCVIIEIIKIKVYKILRIDRLIEKIGNKLNQVLK